MRITAVYTRFRFTRTFQRTHLPRKKRFTCTVNIISPLLTFAHDNLINIVLKFLITILNIFRVVSYMASVGAIREDFISQTVRYEVSF